MNILCCFTFYPLCELTKFTFIGTAMLGTAPSVSQALFHQATSAMVVRTQDCSIYAPETAVGFMVTVQTLV